MFINKPIFVVGVPHSGTSWLGRVIDQHQDVLGCSETNYIWMWGSASKGDDILDASCVTPRIRNHIQSRLTNHIGLKPSLRLCDKTPRNCVRIPFLFELFPDAKIIFVVRDGRAVVRSIKRQNTSPTKQVMLKEVLYRLKTVPVRDLYLYLPRLKWIWQRLRGKPLDYWGVRVPGWKSWLKNDSRHVVIAKQWVEATRIARLDGQCLPPNNYLEINYERLIKSPSSAVREVADFLELDDPSSMVEYAMQTADYSRVNRWKDTLEPDVLADINPIMESLLTELDYSCPVA